MPTVPFSSRLSPQYVATAGQTDFAAAFPALVSGVTGSFTGISMRLVRQTTVSTLVLGEDFNIVGASPSGFTARLVAQSAAGDLLQIYGTLTPERDQALTPGGAIQTKVLETDADRFQVQLQEQARDLARATISPLGEPGQQLPARTALAGAFLYGDPDTGNLVAANQVILTGTPATTFGAGLATAVNAADALVKLGLIDASNPIGVNGATTLDLTALGRLVILSDSPEPAPYQVNLPSGAPVGSIIAVQVDFNATQIITLDGGDVAIEATGTYSVWRGESFIFERRQNYWAPITASKVPIVGGMCQSVAQALTGGQWNTLQFGTTEGDPFNLNLGWDPVKLTFIAPRQGRWRITVNAAVEAIATGGSVMTALQNVPAGLWDATGATYTSNPTAYDGRPTLSALRSSCVLTAQQSCGAGAWVRAIIWPSSNVNSAYYPAAVMCELQYEEIVGSNA